tara:strand:- start:768 stop:1010 length:243 start_codon:yes stop_codon:yes gene_type:complete
VDYATSGLNITITGAPNVGDTVTREIKVDQYEILFTGTGGGDDSHTNVWGLCVHRYNYITYLGAYRFHLLSNGPKKGEIE